MPCHDNREVRLRVEVRPRSYFDSIVLMVASARMASVPGVEAAMAAMATPLNLDMLRESGLWSDQLAAAGPDDLVLAARGDDPEAAIRAADATLSEQARVAESSDLPPARTVRSGVLTLEDACSRYKLSLEEFLSWQRLIDSHGLAGLRVTRLQDYRSLDRSR